MCDDALGDPLGVFFRSAIVSVSVAASALSGPARAEEAPPGAAGSSGPVPSHVDRAWTLSVGTGAGALLELTDVYEGVPAGLAGYAVSRSGRLQANARVDREQGRWVRTGVAYTYQRWTNEYFSAPSVSQGTTRDSIHVLVADITLRWVRARDVELYSGFAAGAAVWRERGTVGGTRYESDELGMAFQFRALGFSLGGEQLRAFAEVGVGFEGLLVGGVALRL